LNPSFVHNGIWRFPRLPPPPTSVGFAAHAADGLRVAYEVKPASALALNDAPPAAKEYKVVALARNRNYRSIDCRA
jgi:hypothetical protein